MKRIILLLFIILSITVKSQEFYSTGDCKASFKFEVNYEINTFAAATVLNFYDTSEGNIKEWYWDFGDGTEYVNEQNPTHIFTHPLGGPTVKMSPYRTVTLTIVTDSCKSTFSQSINIMNLLDTVKQGCFAKFSYYETGRDTVEGTAEIAFVNFSFGENLSFLWQFGDGSTSTEKELVKKFDLNQSEHKVCLTVFGADSCSNNFCDAVVLANDLPWNPGDDTIYADSTWNDCFVSFGYNLKDFLMGPMPSKLVEFYPKVFPEPVEWFWDFGDGTTSNEPNPSHVYYKIPMDSIMNDSTFFIPEFNLFRTVCLTVITADGCKVSSCETIQVFDYGTDPEPNRCQAYFKYEKPDMISIPEVVPIKMYDVTEGEIISRLWKFEDGTTSDEKELLKTFSIFQPVHKVCLTVTFADSCVSTFCDAVYVNGVVIDTVYPGPDCPYYIKVDGGFPIEMSSCAGWASVKVYYGDSLVVPVACSWTTGDTIPNVQGLCPTQTYGVKAIMPDGCVASTEFILSADGSINPVPPVNWWLSGEKEIVYVQSEVPKGYKVEWRLCNGMVIEADSIPLMDINCGGEDSNFILKDSMGNVVYSENISLKGVTGISEISDKMEIKMWPNPVNEQLNIRYSGAFRNNIRVEVLDLMGKRVTEKVFSNISGGREIELKTGALVTGIYVCRITSDGQLLSNQKFSKK